MKRLFGRWAPVAAAVLTAGCHNARIPGGPGEGPRVLPIWEMPGRRRAEGEVLAVILTGDAPLSGLGDRLGRDLAREGFPSAVWSSFRYYLRPRTPDEAAADLDRVIREYRRKWGRDRVVLVGYSMGADVLPFLVNRLPPETRRHVAAVALVALAGDAVFEFRPEQWWGRSSARAYDTRPEVERLSRALPVTCVWGRGDPLTACPSFKDLPMTIVELGGGHHFKSSQRKLTRAILDLVRAEEEKAEERETAGGGR
jgi:type IV secretory pathway VirJ component